MIRATEAMAIAFRQAQAHHVEVTDAIRGMVGNLLQVVLGEWAWEYEELERLRLTRERLQLAVGSGAGTLDAAVYAELAELERFYARRDA